VLPSAVNAHCQEIAEADGIVIVHPTGGTAPAMLKGWIDRVIRQGVAYNSSKDNGEGSRLVCSGEAASSSTLEYPVGAGARGVRDPLDGLWRSASSICAG